MAVEFSIQRTSTADQVADAIRARIINGDLTPGTPLREIALSKALGVSRNTIREGIRVLVGEGLLRHHVHRGVTVAKLTHADVRDIYLLRRHLETAAVRMGRRASPDLSKLTMSADELDVAAKTHDWQRIVDSDFAFHRAVVDLLGVDRLSHFFANVMAELRLGLFTLDRSEDQPAKWVKDHRRICDLVVAGKRSEAARLVSAHLVDAEQRLLELLPEDD
jgi:DNA-binding GntR family transcriptional regulator